jgi:hypothetical protein
MAPENGRPSDAMEEKIKKKGNLVGPFTRAPIYPFATAFFLLLAAFSGAATSSLLASSN